MLSAWEAWVSEPGTEITLDPRRHADDLRQTWQARVLAGTDGQIRAVLLSILAHYFDAEPLQVLLRVLYPGFVSISAPFYCSAAKVDKAGRIVADVVTDYGAVLKNTVVFKSEIDMRGAMRKVADRLRLNDQDRVELFVCAKKWVVADRRLDPTMDPQDPDAKRLVYH